MNPHTNDPPPLHLRLVIPPPDAATGLGMVGNTLDNAPSTMYSLTGTRMNTEARKALSTIRKCIASDRVALTRHFRVRLAERGVLWVDVLAVFDAPSRMDADGVDDAGRSRWIINGRAADATEMGLVCAIGRDEAGELAVFITAFWED